ncbi:FAD/NAD(P)-binding protein [Saccharothrix syringae]|uniref:FAD/NAD(P)-binding protein n=1 Tax=Saccharothrix syringae TaxID=103733 RepID=UPI000525C27A|nr:FAD/NAD(P)-binding protein [Saccharothrix syringae]
MANRICVIGAGPRGLSVLERLCANARTTGEPVEVHVVDPYLGFGGRVWRTGQPDSLVMNTVASQVTMFTDDSVRCAGPVEPGPSLYDWARDVAAGTAGGYSALVRAEAAGLGPDSYPTRAFYGHYLCWFLDHITRTAPPDVTVVRHQRTALSLDDLPGGGQSVLLDDGTRVVVEAVVLAQGHVDAAPTGVERELAGFAARHGLTYLPPGNPAEADHDRVTPGEPVGVRGLGLNFFDHVALLTVGRGGRFTGDRDAPRYEPSGKEPVLYAGSRRGVPYHSRGENQKGATGRHAPLFLDQDTIRDLRRRPRTEFRAHVWPLIAREVEAVYYHALIADRDGAPRAGEFLTEYVRTDPAEVDVLLRAHGVGTGERWDWDAVAQPLRGLAFAGPGAFRRWMLDHLRSDLAQARRGNVRGPLKAALDVLRDLRNEVRLAVDQAGIAGASYRDELRSWYTPLNAFTSIGPPPSRVAELVALVEAGVVVPVGPELRVRPGRGGFVVSSPAVAGSQVLVTALVEARLPAPDLRTATEPLLGDMVGRGQCRPYRIPDDLAGAYETGAVDVTARPYRVVDRAGRPHPARFAYGVPTESVHWATAAGIRPGVDSVILGDSDAIARACLGMG